MRKVLLTGMSGTGKSSALGEQRGFEVVDTDRGGWSVWSDAEGGYVWREERIAELLDGQRRRTLYVSGTVSNQVGSTRASTPSFAQLVAIGNDAGD